LAAGGAGVSAAGGVPRAAAVGGATAGALAAAAGWKPQRGGGDVHFADVQVFVETEDAAHAYLAVEVTSLDRESGHSTVDARDASVSLARLDGEWVIMTAELKEMPGRR